MGTYPLVRNNFGKPKLIPDTPRKGERFIAEGRARDGLGSWWGNGLPSLRSIAVLRGRSATLGLRHGPDSYGRQQWGILDNGGNPDPAMPRE